MSLCAQCGNDVPGAGDLCEFHTCAMPDDWATANRIMCDFLHRGRVPIRLAPEIRDEVFWAPEEIIG